MNDDNKNRPCNVLNYLIVILGLANVVALAALLAVTNTNLSASGILEILDRWYSLAVSPVSTNETTTRSLHHEFRKEGLLSNHRLLLSKDSENDHLPLSLDEIRILVAIAAYDFSQLPHLEEVLDGYHDACVAGATVRVVIHTTVAWPVTLLDLLQTRFPCSRFHLDIILKLPRIKLHLVDCHRQLFYDNLDAYDLFIYTEDDMRVTPRTMATYLQETKRVELLLQEYNNQNPNSPQKWKPSDFNVGVVRYEYNFPSNLVIDDTNRHATENVTRVYWEHSSFKPPLIPNAMDQVSQEPLAPHYVHMKNHHQGMFLATPDLLRAWKEREGCAFHIASNRPGRGKNGKQPLFGTQRVWKSSLHLLGNNHGCRVQQVLPMQNFGALTVHHLPNKNYRRVGQYRTRDMNRTEVKMPDGDHWMTAMQLHIALAQSFPLKPREPSQIRISMQIDPANPSQFPPEESWKPTLDAFQAYLDRGGILSKEDMQDAFLA